MHACVQAPRCKGLSPQLTELLYTLRTNVLLWPADHASASGRFSSPSLG